MPSRAKVRRKGGLLAAAAAVLIMLGVAAAEPTPQPEAATAEPSDPGYFEDTQAGCTVAIGVRGAGVRIIAVVVDADPSACDLKVEFEALSDNPMFLVVTRGAESSCGEISETTTDLAPEFGVHRILEAKAPACGLRAKVMVKR